jgi:transcriptional antiterminator NusG
MKVAFNSLSDFKRLTVAKCWFAVFTVPRHEKRVEEHFRRKSVESFLPLYATRRQWKDGTKTTLQLPLFPCYIFVRIGYDARVRVLETPGVRWIVGSKRLCVPVPDCYIHWLQEGLGKRIVEPHPYLAAGTRVRINSGPMVGLEGVLLRNKNNCRVVLTLEMIMKSVLVEVAADEIEPVSGMGLSQRLM